MPSPTTPVKAVKVDENARKLIVVLEQACLETFKVSVNGKEDKYMLLNADDHVRFCVCANGEISFVQRSKGFWQR